LATSSTFCDLAGDDQFGASIGYGCPIRINSLSTYNPAS